MNRFISYVFARKYFFSRRSANAIHFISGISILGISIGTAALILVLSVFNGFEELITKMLNRFNPDLKISSVEGKSFKIDSNLVSKIKHLDGVKSVSLVLEEKALFESNKVQDFGTIKGVDKNYNQVSEIDSVIMEGEYVLKKGDIYYGVLGYGLSNKLGSSPSPLSDPISIYSPNEDDSGFGNQAFTRRFIYPGALFSIQQDVDYEYILASLDFVQDLLHKPQMASGIEIKLKTKNDVSIQQIIEKLVGKDFKVKNRYQQEEAFLKLMNIEKWVSFAILTLTLLLVAFNMTCALWMLVLEKKPDIAVLKSMGMKNEIISKIFLNLGIMLSMFGFGIGLILSLILYYLQKNMGLVGVPEGFAVNAYPILMKTSDVLVIMVVVFVIGFLASLFPARMASKTSAVHKYN